MSAAAPHPSDRSDVSSSRAESVLAFWTKANNDWIFNLSGMLAYTFLMSIFPLLVVLLAIAGFILNVVSPAAQDQIQRQISAILPNGGVIIQAVTRQLQHSAGILFVVGLLLAAFTGSRLFILLEGCFGIVFRLRPRDPLHQNLMALGMLAIYLVLIPLISLSSVIPSAILAVLGPLGDTGAVALLLQALGIALTALFALSLFASIYLVVPNRQVRLGEVWPGTLVAAALLVLYDLLFPFYESYFLHPGNYGSLAGFAVVILVFFYYLAFILLIGAEINAWVVGRRRTQGDLVTVLQSAQP